MATQLQIYNEALRLIGEHSLANTSVDEEPRYVLDDAYSRVVLYCLSQGWWRFAFFSTSINSTASAQSGFGKKIAKPVDWLRTHSVCLANNSTRLVPIDWFEIGSDIAIKTPYTSAILRYVYTNTTEANWPEVFAKVVAAYLAFECCERISQSRSTKGDLEKIFQDRLATARLSESYPPPLMLSEHAVERATRALLESGFWRFSVVTAAPSSTTSPATGYSNAFTLPVDFMRVYDVLVESSGKLRPVDWRIEGSKLSAKASSVRLQYVSSSYVDPTTWPEAFIDAVENVLILEEARAAGAPLDKLEPMRAQADKVINAALAKDGLARPQMLPEHAVDRVVRSQLESGLWKFAIKTVALTPNVATPSPGYTYAFDKPTDWQRTVRVFRLTGTGLSAMETDLDFRDENNDLHANYSPIHLRYILSTAATPTSWSELFTVAVEAGLRFESAKAEQIGEAEVDARYRAWREALGQAILKDCLNERPKVYKTSVFNNARRTIGSGNSFRREQGL